MSFALETDAPEASGVNATYGVDHASRQAGAENAGVDWAAQRGEALASSHVTRGASDSVLA